MAHADWKYLWWTAALFGLLGLVGLGTVLYKPLRLRYAVYQVRHGQYWDRPGISRRPGDACLVLCLEAACRGNGLAIDAIIDRGVSCASIATSDVWDAQTIGPSFTYEAAAAQPALFFELLDKRDDRKAREILDHIAVSCEGGDIDVTVYFSSARDVASALEESVRSKDPEVRRVAQAALDFTRRRFAKELAEAEKAERAKKPREPKP